MKLLFIIFILTIFTLILLFYNNTQINNKYKDFKINTIFPKLSNIENFSNTSKSREKIIENILDQYLENNKNCHCKLNKNKEFE